MAAQVAHLPLRVYVMGDRAVRLEAARPEDIAEMRRLTIEALRAGAFGFTTTMFGNCGVGFAPVKPHHRAALMDLMEGVEEIPGVVLAEGLTLEWESFSDFLDALDRRPHVIDVAAPKRMSFSASVPHSAPWAPAPSA